MIALVSYLGFVSIASIFSSGNAAKIDGKGVVSPLEPLLEIKKSDSKLSEVIQPIIADEDGEYAIAIENLSTGEVFDLSADREFLSASLYKLWVMGTVYEKLEEGSISKNTVMSEEIPKLNEAFGIASESAELTEGSVSMSVSEALDQMITVSHNYAALLLSRAVRLSNVSNLMKKHGLDSSHLDPPTTTASDIAKFYKDLYGKKVVSTEASEEMLGLLKAQELNDRIPKYLPKNIEIAHKTGELDRVKHDAGIVFTPRGDYIIVLMSETNNQANAAEVEARISEAVYNYFNE